MNWLKNLYLYVVSKLRKKPSKASLTDSYAELGIKEDLAFVLECLNPSETPFYKKKADQVSLYEWKTDAIKTKEDKQ